MLSCADFLAEFGDYIDDTASSDLRAHLEEHLRECKTCRVIVDSTRKTIEYCYRKRLLYAASRGGRPYRECRNVPHPSENHLSRPSQTSTLKFRASLWSSPRLTFD